LDNDFLTIRERIKKVLASSPQPLSIDELGEILGLKPHERKRLAEDLYHLMMSMKRDKKYKLIVVPPRCLDCGYIFKGKYRFKRPSRCPKCGSYRIKGPWFQIKQRG
jgi:predicted Zn-ribbon and HTH transcriptional regulator